MKIKHIGKKKETFFPFGFASFTAEPGDIVEYPKERAEKFLQTRPDVWEKVEEKPKKDVKFVNKEGSEDDEFVWDNEETPSWRDLEYPEQRKLAKKEGYKGENGFTKEAIEEFLNGTFRD